ncbi:MAG: hypothetical protein ACE14P_01510 [Methanotrichaceae archaeon]
MVMSVSIGAGSIIMGLMILTDLPNKNQEHKPNIRIAHTPQGVWPVKRMLLKSVLLTIAYFLIILAAIVNSFELANASKSMQDGPTYSGYSSSYNNSSIRFEGQSNIIQAPTTMSVGNGYYSTHPISYGNAIGSQTSIKNGRSSTSMQRDISYAHGINGQMGVAATDSSYSIDGSKLKSSLTTHMMVDENVTDGHVHIGVLQGSNNSKLATNADGAINSGTDPTVNAWKKPAMEIDEDYIGTFHIYKNMTIHTGYNQNKRNDNWLDFLNGGYFDIILPGPVSNDADNIFNCKAANPWRILEARQK